MIKNSECEFASMACHSQTDVLELGF